MSFIRSIATTALLATTMGLAAFLPTPAVEIAQAQEQQEQLEQTPAPVQRPVPRSESFTRANRTIWHKGETLRQEDDWVESVFPVDKEGRRLILAVQGSVEVQSAQVELSDGQVQPIQVRTQPYGSGEYLMVDFEEFQYVQSVRLVGRTGLSKSAYSVQLRN